MENDGCCIRKGISGIGLIILLRDKIETKKNTLSYVHNTIIHAYLLVFIVRTSVVPVEFS